MVETRMNKKTKKPNKKTSNTFRGLLFFVVVFLALYALSNSYAASEKVDEVALSDVIARANDENGNIKKITVSRNDLNITLKDKDYPTEHSRKDASGTLYEQGLKNNCEKLSND
jgi:cell division protein FtsB